MTSIYDYRAADWAAEARRRMERRRAILEWIVCGPVILATVVAWVILGACL